QDASRQPAGDYRSKNVLEAGFQAEIGHLFTSEGASEWRESNPPLLNHGDLCGREESGYKGLMGLRAIYAGWLVVAAPVLLGAQSKPVVSNATQTVRRSVTAMSPATARLLDENDGLAVLGAALETRHKTAQNSDCSHLVHAIYEKAGFSYKYASSRD